MTTTAVRPTIGHHYDGRPYRHGNPIHFANPSELAFERSCDTRSSKPWRGKPEHTRWLMHFGCVGTTYVLVYAHSLDDALGIAAEWLLENELFGHITPHSEPLEELGCDCADPFECDSHTYTESGWLTSWEWGAWENPTNKDLLSVHRS